MTKKNLSWQVTFLKILESAKDAKWACITLIVLMMTLRWSCNNKEEKVKFEFGCSPLRISDVKEIVK